MVKASVHSTKHYVQTSITPILAGAKLDVTAVNSVAVSNKNVPAEVEEGSDVKAVFLELWIRSSEASPGSFVFIFEKRPSNVGSATVAQMAQLHDYPNKKNILYTTQGLINDNSADAIAIYKGWIKIPKGKQRMGLGDRLAWSCFAQGAIDMLVCGFQTYKEYS